jgi:hypothetical protein
MVKGKKEPYTKAKRMTKPTHITSSDCIPEDERYHMPRYLGFRPVDSQNMPSEPTKILLVI